MTRKVDKRRSMAKKQAPKELEDARRLAEAHGFELVRKRHYVKRTVDVDETTYKAFTAAAKLHGYKIKEALTTAMEDFIEHVTKTAPNGR